MLACSAAWLSTHHGDASITHFHTGCILTILSPLPSHRDKVILLNRLTEVINFWQAEDTKHTVEEARQKFPDCAFA